MDQENFQYLYDTNHHLLYPFVYYLIKDKESAEEVLHRIYEKALDKKLFLMEKETSRSALFVYARNLCFYYRLKSIFRLHPTDDSALEETDIYHSLSSCRFIEQQVIICIHILKLTYEETENILSIPANKAEEIEKKAVRKLTKKMTAAGMD
ncbi:hypothetical protein ABES80_08965 [Bacillus gobiensis]|uniref:RNA polymerase sigma factor n=1 Tax=Bacillus gobiensis TaxID=1441095 RepID=UPI003D22FCDE